ncbi:MAG: DUF4870 domain-containing protein [candidate division KSB1 bacterium]|jgi:uncharacterized Tic20 family protein|nr:DUF4870 domain-containing protein [candidate division KSB1 bacterium]
MAEIKKSKVKSTTKAQPPSKDEKMWAMLCHVSTIIGFVIPFGNILAPLVIWLIKKDEYPLVNDQGKEAVNFQITMTIAILISAFLTIILIGIPLLIALGIAWIVLIVIASMKSYEGEEYRYPYAIRLID